MAWTAKGGGTGSIKVLFDKTLGDNKERAERRRIPSDEDRLSPAAGQGLGIISSPPALPAPAATGEQCSLLPPQC